MYMFILFWFITPTVVVEIMGVVRQKKKNTRRSSTKHYIVIQAVSLFVNLFMKLVARFVTCLNPAIPHEPLSMC